MGNDEAVLANAGSAGRSERRRKKEREGEKKKKKKEKTTELKKQTKKKQTNQQAREQAQRFCVLRVGQGVVEGEDAWEELPSLVTVQCKLI